MNILFVCSRNQWRSPTAEAIFRNHAYIDVRSGGTSPSARRRVSEADLRWADVVFAMQDRHVERLHRRFPLALSRAHVVVLDIPDDYTYMDEELVGMLRDGVDAVLSVAV